MIGPEGAALLTAEHLGRRVPVQLAGARARLDLLPEDLPDPGLVLPVDKLRLGVEDYPAVLVEALRLVRLVRVDVVDGLEVYAGRYAVRAYVFVRGDDQLDTDLVRKRYVLAVREALLARRQLAELGAPPSGIAVDPVSIAESYSPSMTDDAGATIAAAWLDVDVVVREELQPDAPVGTVATLEADTRTLPHPGTL